MQEWEEQMEQQALPQEQLTEEMAESADVAVAQEAPAQTPEAAVTQQPVTEPQQGPQPYPGYRFPQWGYDPSRGQTPGFGAYPTYGPGQPEPRIPCGTEKKPETKAKSGKLRRVLGAVGAFILVAGLSFGVSALVADRLCREKTENLIEQMENISEDYEEKLEELQDDMDRQNADYERQLEAIKKRLNQQGSAQFPTQGELPEGMMTPAQLYSTCVSSVVAISNQEGSRLGGYATVGTGSGFILTEDGYIVSNHHVVEGADKLIVTMSDGSSYEAELVGSDNVNDLALLKVEGDDPFPAVQIGSSDALQIGDQVVAIGNPLGDLTATATVGYISGKDRPVNTEGVIIDMLQTDAAINSGNSGGPLFNMYGQVVGITTAKYSGTTTSGASIEGIGFAIPIDDVYGMIQDFKDFGFITGGYLGVMVSSMDPEVASVYNLPVGAFVRSVTEGSCAEKAGIQAEDIITALEDYEVENLTDLTRALRNFQAGDEVEVVIYRAGATLTLTVVLDEKPAS